MLENNRSELKCEQCQFNIKSLTITIELFVDTEFDL